MQQQGKKKDNKIHADNISSFDDDGCAENFE